MLARQGCAGLRRLGLTTKDLMHPGERVTLRDEVDRARFIDRVSEKWGDEAARYAWSRKQGARLLIVTGGIAVVAVSEGAWIVLAATVIVSSALVWRMTTLEHRMCQ